MAVEGRRVIVPSCGLFRAERAIGCRVGVFGRPTVFLLRMGWNNGLIYRNCLVVSQNSLKFVGIS